MNHVMEHGLNLASVSAEFEAARSLIEDRFLKGGEALMSAHEIVTTLFEALDGVTGALSDAATDAAAGQLAATMNGLACLVRTDAETRDQLAAVMADGAAIGPRVVDMQGALRYLSTCALETKIAGAGVPEFVSFADDVTSYVTNAANQVAIFASRVTLLNLQLSEAAGQGSESPFAAKVPRVTKSLTEASQAVRSARARLGKLAAAAETVAKSVQAKVGKVLSALQVGDVTRQRIEHVQAGVTLLEEALAEPGTPEDDAALLAAGIELLRAQTAALIRDFHLGTSVIIATIDGLAFEAERILSLTRGLSNENTGDPIAVIEDGVAQVRTIVSGIEEASRRAAVAYAETRKVATELLGDMGSIGNLRNVRDDIRCLAINAYLRSNRIGEKGRAVGVVAAEMNNYATRLGVAAEGILARLAAMQAATSEIGAAEERRCVVGDLDEADRTLCQASRRTGEHLAFVADKGNAVAARISEIAGQLDFRSELGDRLETCRQMFNVVPVPVNPDDPRLEAFSSRLYGVYTMASERDIHRTTLPNVRINDVENPATKDSIGGTDALFDDVLF